MEQFATEQPWAIVLAGGEGTRLQSLTRKIEGESRPKQFSKIYGGRSLLGHTRDRLRPVFNDVRVLFVVTKDHETFYRRELLDVDRMNVLDVLSREPRNLLVMEDAASGWADLGHPERVISTLDRNQIEPCWLREVRNSDSLRLNAEVHLRPQSVAAF